MSSLWPSDATSLGVAGTVLIKLGIGAILAGLVGWEREHSGRAAGIRTHILMIFGVILFSEVSKSFPGNEPSRIAAQILTGIGFLGAGTILRVGPEIKGLTTAASIWAVSAIGMAISIGGAFMIIALVATLMTLITLALVTRIERKLFPNSVPGDLKLTLQAKTDITPILHSLNQAGMRISQTQVVQVEPTIVLALKINGNRETVLGTAC